MSPASLAASQPPAAAKAAAASAWTRAELPALFRLPFGLPDPFGGIYGGPWALERGAGAGCDVANCNNGAYLIQCATDRSMQHHPCPSIEYM